MYGQASDTLQEIEVQADIKYEGKVGPSWLWYSNVEEVCNYILIGLNLRIGKLERF